MSQINISDKAYAKMMLHCVKHTINDCYGILIGTSDQSSITVTDAIPLFHDRIFAPQLEIAFKFIELFIENEQNKIIGMYENSILNNDKESESVNVSSFATFICDSIQNKRFKLPLVFEIFSRDNEEKQENKKSEVILQMFRYIDQNQKVTPLPSFNETTSHFNLLKNLLKDFKENEIVDFDDHFLDCNLDWRNNFVDEYLK